MTARFLLLSSLAACSKDDGDGDDDDAPTVPVVCDAGNNTQVSTPTTTDERQASPAAMNHP